VSPLAWIGGRTERIKLGTAIMQMPARSPATTAATVATLDLLSGGRMLLGGAKPVPVNPRKYRNFRRGDIIVSLAGVATNAVIGVACVALIAATGLLGRALPSLASSLAILQAMLYFGVWINAVLIAFNLLPIPPLDGSHVFKYLLPRPLAIQYVRFGRFGLLVLVLLLVWGERVLNAWMFPAALASDWGLSLVSSFWLPTVQQWIA
jgi:Zn-dependent protease